MIKYGARPEQTSKTAAGAPGSFPAPKPQDDRKVVKERPNADVPRGNQHR